MKLNHVVIAVILCFNFIFSLDREKEYLIIGGGWNNWTIIHHSSSTWKYYKPDGEYYSYYNLSKIGCDKPYIIEKGFYECEHPNNNSWDANMLIDKSDLFPDKLPPILSIENIRFIKDQMSQFAEVPVDVLLGGESGYIEFDIVNNGKGGAKAVSAYLSGQHNSIVTKKKLNGKESYHVKFPISAPLSTEDTQYNYTISAIDYNEFEADPENFSVEVRKVSTPNFEMGDIIIDDDQEGDSWGNSNQAINKGEAVELTFALKNTGSGIADNVSITIKPTNTPKGFFLSSDQKLSFNFESFDARSERRFTFSFLTNKKTEINKLPIKVEITEKSGEFGKTFDLDLPIKRGPE